MSWSVIDGEWSKVLRNLKLREELGVGPLIFQRDCVDLVHVIVVLFKQILKN
jgi:hypothetical protein